MLHIHVDELIAAIEARSVDPPANDDGQGFRIAMIGDSTMRVSKRARKVDKKQEETKKANRVLIGTVHLWVDQHKHTIKAILFF